MKKLTKKQMIKKIRRECRYFKTVEDTCLCTYGIIFSLPIYIANNKLKDCLNCENKLKSEGIL